VAAVLPLPVAHRLTSISSSTHLPLVVLKRDHSPKLGMPVNQRQQTVQSPSSTTPQSTAKYTNKDGSKFITVPKVFGSIDSPETSPAMAQIATKTNGQVSQTPQNANGNTTGVNRKKQKRRQKQAERLAAEQASKAQDANGTQSSTQIGRQPQENLDQRENGEYDPAESTRANYSDEEGDGYSGSYERSNSPANGYTMASANTKSKKKRKGKGTQSEQSSQLSHPTGPSSNPPSASTPLQSGMSKEKIWNTSSQEERERIKMFWLSLGEEERRSLVKVEKDAVLKKMKEQQKHSCSCTVCGRKRIAIEEELEVLYDAYYEELEQYANHQQGDGPPPMMSQSRRFGPMSGLQPPSRLPPAFSGRQPSRGKIVEHFDNDEDEEGDEEEGDDFSEEEEYLSDDEAVEEVPRSHATDFFNFGQSLTVQG
jgi:Salt tolerance down-regulator